MKLSFLRRRQPRAEPVADLPDGFAAAIRKIDPTIDFVKLHNPSGFDVLDANGRPVGSVVISGAVFLPRAADGWVISGEFWTTDDAMKAVVERHYSDQQRKQR